MKKNLRFIKSLPLFGGKIFNFELEYTASKPTFLRMSSNQKRKNPNCLINERSPYLLQHAYNPVEWYPWGEEAFQKARNESKLIFLSVGYSTCHWCHVMEKESFENMEIAKILNEHFVPIKVDREERPDVDRVYMTFVQATSGQGGWPMSVWLTPDLKPFVGGTYFPPEDSINRRGFKSILQFISQKWNEDQSKCHSSADKIMESIQKAVKIETNAATDIPEKETCDKCVEQMIKNFDGDLGGFGGAPKFPQPVNFNFLLRYHSCNPNTELGNKALNMVEKTLQVMSDGGIHDNIGYGFHRYSTDQYWHVPHFEKMLYDQGQLAVAYADCYAVTKDEKMKETLCKILDYVARDLTHPSGGFYSAEDADSLPKHDDSVKKEGAFYVFSWDEMKAILSAKIGEVDLADLARVYYGVQEHGNVSFEQDPHGELRGKNVLIIRSTISEIATQFNLPPDDVSDALEKARKILLRERNKRPRPHLDNKMLTAWNALMISGFARAACVTNDESYGKKATLAAQFIRRHLYVESSNTLLRSCYAGMDAIIEQIEQPIEGFDADYSYTIRALLDLYEATYDEKWVEWAAKLQEKQTELFWDAEGGGYYSVTQSDPSVLLRMKEDQDGAEPSANSVSALNLFRLSAYLNKPKLRAQGEKLLRAFGNRLRTTPYALPEMASALLWFWNGHKQIVVQGNTEAEDTKSFLRFINSTFLPNKIIIPPVISASNGFLCGHLEDSLSGLSSARDDRSVPAVFVCENFACQLPARTLKDLKSLL